jgi:membrane protein required for colicin V production
MEGLLSTLKQFNWVDIFVVIIFIRICYVSLKSGFPVELFKFLGVVLAIYLSLHYYTSSADFIDARIKKVPLEFSNLFSFAVLAILGNLIFVLLRSIFYRFIHMEAVPQLNKWGGFILGIARGILVISLLTFILVMSNIGYLKRSVANSYSGEYFLRVAPNIYSGLWNNLISKFMTKEKFNKAVLDIQAGS